MMTVKSRILMFVASILLLSTFLFPIWNIDLHAPQYPEGIGLRIWINQITGLNEFDLHNINKLNHYIGMKEIQPDAIKELKIMPYIIIGFVLLGLLITLLKRKKLVVVWLVLLLITLGVGLYDFYLWEYDYGHNLNPNAAIKVPGMVYQPPLIGSKKLLNMNAVSLPGIGGIFIGISVVLSSLAIYYDRKNK